MNCLECRELLHKRLDGEPIAAEMIEQHLSQCATCREQHAGAVMLLDGLKKLPDARPSAGFAHSMVAQVMRDRRHRQERMRRRVFATMALAASVLILLGLTYYWMPSTGPVEPIPKDKIVEKEQKKDVPPAPKDELKNVPKKDADPVVAPDRWAGTVRDHAKVVIAAANPNVRDAGLDGINKLPVAQEVSVGVDAVTRSTRKAFDFFARELPMPEVGEH